jgi:hypothetical protein
MKKIQNKNFAMVVGIAVLLFAFITISFWGVIVSPQYYPNTAQVVSNPTTLTPEEIQKQLSDLENQINQTNQELNSTTQEVSSLESNQKLTNQPDGTNIIHITTYGSDSGDGSSASPMASIDKAIAKLDSAGIHDGRIIVHNGTYVLKNSIEIKPASDNSRTLTIEAGQGEAPVLDGSQVITAQPLSGQAGIYLISISYSGTNMPQIWHQNQRIRYVPVQSFDVLKSTDYGAYPYSANTIAIHPKGGVLSDGSDLRGSVLDYGFIITRSNVKVDKISFTGFAKTSYSAGIVVGANNYSPAVDNINLLNVIVSNSYSGISTLKGTSVRKVNINNCDIRDVATGINAHGGDVSITYCKIINDARASNLFAFKQVDVYMGEAGINVRDSYSTAGCEYKYNVIKGFKYGIALQATENQTNGGGYAKYSIEHNTIVLAPDDVISTGSSMGIQFSRYVGTSCANCGPDKAQFRYNIVDGFTYPWNVNKSGSASQTQANIDQNVFWNSSANKSTYEKDFKDIPSDKGSGTNIVGDPMFVNKNSQDFRVFSGGSALSIVASAVPAGALSSVPGGGNIEPNFSLDIPVIANVQNKVGNSYEVIGSTFKFNITAYDPTSVKNTKISISSPSTETVNITHSYVNQETITLPDSLVTYTITIVIDNGTKTSSPQTITVTKKSSTVSYSDNYVRTSKYGFVVFAKNSQDADQYISYRKKGDTNWTKGFDDSQYSGAIYSDARNSGLQPLIVTGVEPNTDYEYMITTKQGNESSSVYTVNTSGEPKTYYVSTNGEDSFDRGLGASNAFKTLQYAVDLSLPGDTINILAGVYSGTTIMVHSGTVSNHIRITGNPAGGTILGGQNTALSALSLEKVSYVDISNLSIQGVATAGISCNKCSNVSITNSFFANQYIGSSLNKTDVAIILRDSSDIDINHNVIRNWWWGVQVTNSPRTKIVNNTIVSTVDGCIILGTGSVDSEISYNSLNFPINTTMIVYASPQDRSRIKIDYNNLASNIMSTYRGDPDTNTDYKSNYSYFKSSRELSWYYDSAQNGKVYTSFSKWKNDTGWDTNSIVADPMWVDPLKDDFHVKTGSPNLLSNGKYIGAMGPGNNTPEIIIENNSDTIYVSNSGSDTSGDGSSDKPYKTIQKALDNAEAGKTVFIKAGTYDGRRLIFKNSGVSGKPIVIEGEKSSSGERLVTLDGGESMTGWENAPEIGDGVYKVANKVSPVSNLINNLPYSVVVDGKYADPLRSNSYMDISTEWKKYMNMDINAEVTTDNPEHAQSNQALLGKVRFWDVTKAIFYATKDYTYIRLADKSNPNNHTIRGSFYIPGYWSYDTFVIQDKSYITIRDINFRTYTNGISMRGAGSHHINITNNNIQASKIAIEIQSGAHDIDVSNNEIPFAHFGTSFGAWIGSEYTTGNLRYSLDLKQAIYQWYHHWIFNGTGFTGISASADAGDNIDIYNNKLSQGFIAIDVTTINRRINNVEVYGNTISGFSSGAIYARGAIINLQIHNNVMSDVNYAVRNHELNISDPRKVYIYNNWVINPEHVGMGIFFHYFSGHPIPANPPEIYIYHNNLIGGRNGFNFDAYVGEYNGAKGVYVLNNIVSSGDYDLSGANTPEKDFFGIFDYNWFDNMPEVYTKRNWFGANNLKKSNGESKIMTGNTPTTFRLPSNIKAYQAGIDLSKTQNINGKTIGPLPGMSGCSNSKPDMGVIGSCNGGGVIIIPVNNISAYDGRYTIKKGEVLNGSMSINRAINSGIKFLITTQSFRGIVAVRDNGTFTYTPESNFVGTDYFNFKVNDGVSDSNIATIRITVENNDNTNTGGGNTGGNGTSGGNTTGGGNNNGNNSNSNNNKIVVPKTRDDVKNKVTEVVKTVVPVKTPIAPKNVVYQNENRKTETVVNSTAKIKSTLSIGSKGEEVKVLQRVLSKENLLPATLNTGYYGTLTEVAVQRLQKKYNIVTTGSPNTTGFGVVGKKTQDLVNKLNSKIPAPSSTSESLLLPTGGSSSSNTTSSSGSVTSNLKFGSRGEEVKILQQALVKEKLLAPNLTTGYYGTLTQSAVQKLQTKYNVISSGNPQTTGYGSVGPKTKDIINTILKK